MGTVEGLGIRIAEVGWWVAVVADHPPVAAAGALRISPCSISGAGRPLGRGVVSGDFGFGETSRRDTLLNPPG